MKNLSIALLLMVCCSFCFGQEKIVIQVNGNKETHLARRTDSILLSITSAQNNVKYRFVDAILLFKKYDNKMLKLIDSIAIPSKQVFSIKPTIKFKLSNFPQVDKSDVLIIRINKIEKKPGGIASNLPGREKRLELIKQ